MQGEPSSTIVGAGANAVGSMATTGSWYRPFVASAAVHFAGCRDHGFDVQVTPSDEASNSKLEGSVGTTSQSDAVYISWARWNSIGDWRLKLRSAMYTGPPIRLGVEAADDVFRSAHGFGVDEEQAGSLGGGTSSPVRIIAHPSRWSKPLVPSVSQVTSTSAPFSDGASMTYAPPVVHSRAAPALRRPTA